MVEASGLDASEELHVIWALTESVACGEGLAQVRYLFFCGEGLAQVRYLQALAVMKHAIFVLYLLYLLYWYKKSAHTLTESVARFASCSCACTKCKSGTRLLR